MAISTCTAASGRLCCIESPLTPAPAWATMKFFHIGFLIAISVMSNGARLRCAMWRSTRGLELSVSGGGGLPAGLKVLAFSPAVMRIFTHGWPSFSQSSIESPPSWAGPRPAAAIAAFRPANTLSTLKRKPATS